MRWFLRIIACLVILVVVVVAALYIAGSAKLSRTYSVAESALAVPNDSASVARGRHLAVALTKCADCHGAGLAGKIFLDAPPFVIVAPNLTRGRGGIGATFSDSDYARAIRDGVAPDGHGLLAMPAADFAYLSDADLADIIAYVKSEPAVDHPLPATVIRPLGRILLGAGLLPTSDAASIDHTMTHSAAVAPTDTVGYGHYVAQVGGCLSCHGAGLSGGAIPGLPPSFPKAQNITPAGIGKWTDAEIVGALRVGKRPDGSTIDTFMPWPDTALMSDTEMMALVKYLRSVPARASGTR